MRSHDLIRLLNKPGPCVVSGCTENISFEVTRHNAIAMKRLAGGCFDHPQILHVIADWRIKETLPIC